MRYSIIALTTAVIAIAVGYILTKETVVTGEPFSPTELRYKVIQKFGPVGDAPGIFYCDPDYYPIAFRDETEIAVERFPELQANEEEFNTILIHLNLSSTTEFSSEQKLAIYREHKKLNAFTFESTGEQYRFELTSTDEEGLGLGEGTRIEGTIDLYGVIRITEKKEGFITTCPICLSGSTLIDTPSGQLSVKNLREGMEVWTENAKGERVKTTILKTGKTRAPENHTVIHLILEDGRELIASPNHPLGDGRLLGELNHESIVEGMHIQTIQKLPYTEEFTYDILPTGETGIYWANGILLKSTLSQNF